MKGSLLSRCPCRLTYPFGCLSRAELCIDAARDAHDRGCDRAARSSSRRHTTLGATRARLNAGFNKPNDLLITDQFNNRALIVDMNKSTEGQYGDCTAGNGFNQLNAPYTAFVIGDYTGLTPPFGFGH